MGLLLSILVECVGVIEVIACYQHFQFGLQHLEGVQHVDNKDEMLDIKRDYQKQFMESTTVHHHENDCNVCHDELLEQLRDAYETTMFPDYKTEKPRRTSCSKCLAPLTINTCSNGQHCDHSKLQC